MHGHLLGLDLRSHHDLCHTFATWMEDDGIPARVIDELMAHAATRRSSWAAEEMTAMEPPQSTVCPGHGSRDPRGFAGSRSAFPCLYRSGRESEPTPRDRDRAW